MSSEVLHTAKILSGTAPKDFLDSSTESERLLQHARGETETRGLLFLSAPAANASELLRQTYDRLFSEQGEIIPFYFAVKNTDKTAKNCALRFLRTFLLQTVAFRRNEANFFDSSPEIGEIIELASAEDYWIKQLAKFTGSNSQLFDERAFIQNCLSAPLRAAANEARIFVIIDDFHLTENLAGETGIAETLKEIYSRSNVQFVFAGRRRHVLKSAQSGESKLQNVKILRFDKLPLTEAGKLTEKLAETYSVKINEQTRDLIVRQLGSSPLHIESVFIAAGRREMNLDNFQKVQQVYADEIFGGGISKFYDTLLDEIFELPGNQKQLIKLLYKLLTNEAENKLKIEEWQGEFAVSDIEFYCLIEGLHVDEFINFNSGIIEPEKENPVLSDYIEARYILENAAGQRAQAVSGFLAKSLKRASRLMTRFYRRAAALDLRELLASFNCQKISKSLLDYQEFKAHLKGAAEDEISDGSETGHALVKLPEIVFSSSGAAFYPSIKEVLDEERCAVGIGFKSGDHSEESQIAWVSAEIDSKLETSTENTEFWCDRLEMLALACGFSKYQLWLIAPEGFSPEAAEVLTRRNALGSSRKQIELLAKSLENGKSIKEKSRATVYEMVLPMGEDTEIIAAHTVEEIARRYNFQPKAITQMKTALVEACINATEHSLSPDRKIYQKFTVEDDKIIITISNRGIKIPSEKAAEMTSSIEPNGGRRGWGLKLMRTLMDEVTFDQVDDGTRISMVKYLK